MSSIIRAWAAPAAGRPLEPHEYNPGPLGPDEVEIAVDRLHVVGAVLESIGISAMDLIGGQRSVSGSPTGSRSAIDTLLDFAARHQILPQVERFPMSRVNDALDHLRAGKARYRIVLDADFA